MSNVNYKFPVVWLDQSDLAKRMKPKVAVPTVIVAEAESLHTPPARPTPQLRPKTSENTIAKEKQEPQKFRPNIVEKEPKKQQNQEATEKTSLPEENKSKDTKLPEEELVKKITGEKPYLKEEISKYRKQLLAEYQDEWQKVPELNTTIKDLTLLPEIDKHFGIVILAYSFIDNKPGAPFIIFNTDLSTYQKLESFDFSSFSNRIKDRMLYARYRKNLEKARKEYKINSLMKVIGLVPMETDHYFSAKQLRAVQLAVVNLGQVIATNGHYEPNASGGFNLIIDTLLTTNARTIPIQDEELKFSIVAKQ